MRTTTSRCTNCGDIYQYQMSGSYIPENNSHTHCPSCEDVRAEAYKLVTEALAKIPKVREVIWVEDIHVTYDELIEDRKRREEKEDKEAAERGQPRLLPRARRVFSSLSQYELGEFTHLYVGHSVGDMFDYRGHTYRTEFWTHEPDKVKVEVKKEWIIETGEIIDYKEYNI